MGGRLTWLSQRNNYLWENVPHVHSGKCWKPDALSMRSSYLSWAVFYCGLDCHFMGCSGLKAACVMLCQEETKEKSWWGSQSFSFLAVEEEDYWPMSRADCFHTGQNSDHFFEEQRPATRFSACDLTAPSPCRKGGAVLQRLPAGCTSTLPQLKLKEEVVADWVLSYV